MKGRTVALYALGGVSKQYIALDFWVFWDGYSVGDMKDVIDDMISKNPSVREIYMVDYKYDYKLEYQRSRKKHDIESCIIFRDMLQRDGWKVFG